MAANTPTILALDFDGVICDGLKEYFETAWRTYCEVWEKPSEAPPIDLADKFYRLRPVIETGWEMPVLIEALLTGVAETEILDNWSAIAHAILQQHHLKAADVGKKLDEIRDQWIASDLEGWLSLHRFYPGVVEKLASLVDSEVKVFIVTTKEGRFVQQLLQQQSILLPEKAIFGKENKRPKYEILRDMIAGVEQTVAPVSLWFVEDRMKTLELVIEQANMGSVKLFLADWGYNTAKERESAQHHPQIELLTLAQFTDDFAVWS